MRALWICNVVLNDFVSEFDLSQKPFGGWIEALFRTLRYEQELELGFCFPIIDEFRRKSGVGHGCRYYSYDAEMDRRTYRDAMKEEFKPILSSFCPDVIFVWGTEYNHSRAMVEACRDLGLQKKIIVRIQGLVSVCSLHYTLGIPVKYLNYKAKENVKSILEGRDEFQKRGENETQILKNVHYISSRGVWDEFCLQDINPNAICFKSDNILRDVFYTCAGKWQLNHCHRHSIFVSQASYPVKGLHFLLQAMKILKKKYPDISLRVAGFNILNKDVPECHSGYAKYLMDLIEDFSLQKNIEFIGLLSEDGMVQEYLAAHVSVCPSTIENRANSMCEAMMVGTPMIASYVGGNIDAIQNGVDGYLYPVDEFYMLAGYIDRIFSDDNLAVKMSREGTKTAMERHDKEKIRKSVMDMYHRIAGV